MAPVFPNGHRIALHEQKPNVKDFGDDTLTKAYGSWALPEMVKQLAQGNRSLQTKVLIAFKEEVFTVHEGICEGVEAGVVPVLIHLLPSHDDAGFRVLIFEVLELLSKQTIGRNAISGAEENLKALKPHMVDAESQVRLSLARALKNICQTTEGANACFAAAYLDALTVRFKPSTAENDAEILVEIMQALTMMMSKSMSASQQAAKTLNADDFLGLTKSPFASNEEFLCVALDMIQAVCMEDVAKDAMIGAGSVHKICVMLHGAEPDPSATSLAVTTGISWKGKSKLWGVLASLLIRNQAKFQVVQDGWLRLLLCALRENDSILVVRAAVQVVMHAADHPEARSTLKVLIPELQSIMANSEPQDVMVQKLCKKCIAQLEWIP
eukprot:gnl/MRDRNA2_/MRDRNA2_39151_c0_seq1.p1 gnl/MRDRNA2_/MRDRNA2_39151_c0~~gnl/MRDRNA2_/MRDRNA2_39151_c0_seq1.p1  ORF type:complete len:410 (+),score=84.55 gnl/MRDRNA2_/MRDRNA2_39151_c0_seq1:86-1231(+)